MKSNEITSIPELLDQIEIKKSVVTIDAAGCQRNIAAKIFDRKGDYVLALKGNQGSLHRAVTDYIFTHMENDFADVTVRKHVEHVKGHRREDELIYYQLPVPEDLAWLKRFAISLLKQVDDKESIAMRRRMAGWNPNFLAKVLGIPTI